MPKNTQISAATINQQADALARRLDDGYLRIYTGIQPATADTAISGNTLIAEMRFAAIAAPAAINGAITFDPPQSTFAQAGGTATWYRCLMADGTTAILDGSIGAAGDDPNLIVASPIITAGQVVLIGALSHTVLRAYIGL